jgi:uncharacterized protein
MRPDVVAVLLAGLLAAGIAAAQAPTSGIDAARAALERGDWAAAKVQLEPLLQRRDPRAQVMVAALHYARGGTGSFAEDPDTACDLYDRAAAANTGDGLFGLGRCFAEGRGRPQDAVEAMRLFDRAAEKGATRAWCAMGRLYFDGAGVRADQTRGTALCRQGSSMGDAEADLELGLRHLNGVGLPKSFTDARPWLDRAAQRGNAQASRALAQAYATGNGVGRDSVQSLRYLEQAAKAGDLESALQMTSQRAPALLHATADRRTVIDSMYWLAMIARAHPDPKRRELAQHDLADLRTRFANLTMEADFKLEKEPLRTALPQ